MKEKINFKELKTIIKYYKPYKKLFAADMAAAMLRSAAMLIIPLIVRHITSEVVYRPMTEAWPEILKLGAIMIALALLQLAAGRFTGYWGHMLGTYQERDMRSEIFGHLQKLSFTFYDNEKVGSILSRITSDLFDISELLHHGPENILICFCKFVGAFVVLSIINIRLALISLVVVAIMAGIAFYYNQKLLDAFAVRREVMSKISGQIEDELSGIRVVKSFANEAQEMENFEKLNEEYVKTKSESYGYMAKFFSSVEFFCTLITVISVIIGALFIAKGEMTVPDLVLFIMYIANFEDPIMRLTDFAEQFQNGYSGYVRFRRIVTIAPDITDAPDALPLENCRGDVEFEHVSFHYQNHEALVLKDINVQAHAGDYIALCGPSGAGKTTFCSLIPRFYDVTDGAVRVDGTDVRRYRLEDLRNQIGIVQQDVYLFAGTVMENIRYGKPDATREECIAAAKAANADAFIRTLPDGYDTDIGQRGVKLSGGQKQRISIARVFLKNPPILVFDEATSSLDNESEQVIQESLETLSKGRTTFVIAHRLSTIKNAPRILVLTEDGIAEDGTHEELLALGGVYSSLYQAGH